ncbi:zinc finger MYM-type 1-like [Paramuricea clavata]|uniref:Zinc finger MYM-type 1-like n=1 Tax=Paramuricea clavata TaxID=317549 RepID=A0A7D9EF33_PARCT|nr:zinc finger MYM-type 1-like [Paramuricea clavata]
MQGSDDDGTTRRKASALLKKILEFNFIFAVMFMRVIMRKTQILTTEMQKPEFNILDALTLIDGTVTSLERIRSSEVEMNDQIQSSVEFAKSFGLNPEENCAQKRPRIEFSVFENIVNSEKKSGKTVHDVADVAYRNKSILPAVYKCFKLLLTAPVTVAKNERTFSKMKVIKNFLRSTMSGERLEDLIVLAAEKNLTDKIDFNVVLKAWIAKKNRKLPIKLL